MTKFDRDFEEWYDKNYTNVENFTTIKLEVLNELPIEMLFGIYQIFANSVGFDMSMKCITNDRGYITFRGEFSVIKTNKVLCKYDFRDSNTLLNSLISRLKEEYNEQ